MPELITVRESTTGKTVSFQFSVPKSMSAMIREWGELVVYKLAYEKAKSNATNSARGLLMRGHTEEETVRIMENEWSPVKRLKTCLSMAINKLGGQTDADSDV